MRRYNVSLLAIIAAPNEQAIQVKHVFRIHYFSNNFISSSFDKTFHSPTGGGLYFKVEMQIKAKQKN